MSEACGCLGFGLGASWGLYVDSKKHSLGVALPDQGFLSPYARGRLSQLAVAGVRDVY